jgi:hypothetical protein
MPTGRLAVIDSNVLIAANGKSDQANDACVDRCVEILVEVSQGSSLAMDDGNEILNEYSRYCNYSGQPGVGDRFFLWAQRNQYATCLRVALNPHEDRGYEEFPDTPDLAKFDPSDRKFVATALGCTPTATIYNAVDSDYAQHAQALADAAIPVTELCPDCLKPEYRTKLPPTCRVPTGRC